MAYLCGECGTLMDVTKDFISKSDLRKVVEYLEDKMSEPVSAREAYQDAADRVEELLGGK